MSEWISLLDACNIRTGKLDSNMEEPEGNYPFFTCAPKPHRINSFSFEGDVIILAGNNAAGNFHCQRYSGKFDAYQRTYVITAGSNFDIDYIFYYLKLNLIYFSKKSQGSQTKFLTMTILNDFVIKVLPIDEQQKISKLLKFLDQKIALNNHINEELEAMAKTLYDYWFVQFDFPDENGKPYKSSGGKMVYNDQLKREIPEGWGVDSLWNIATFYNGLAMQKFRPASETDESLPVIKIREMFSGFSKDTEKASTAIPKEAIIEAGDILFSWSATLEVILWGGEKGALNQHIFKVTSEKYPKSFIYNELRSYLKVFKTIAELRKTTMGHITQDHLKQAMIIVPPNDLIDEIHNRISPILKQQLDLKQQNQELTQLRDWLLPMLMNGQARVEDKT
ncbi:restriction endonuclease subunit S [Streptococcus suis]|nr:restriction endonuclease subunit S [Streptococcus suis]ULL20910.1 restriction endonuclease subunit S [Streptococcus suis]